MKTASRTVLSLYRLHPLEREEKNVFDLGYAQHECLVVFNNEAVV